MTRSDGEVAGLPAALGSAVRGTRRGRDGGRLTAALAGATAAWSLGQQITAKYQERRRARAYTIAVNGNDELYPAVQRWVLLEDIDIVHASKARDDAESPGLSLSALLNGLDGVITPHGLITVMTTNDLSVLDPALTRPGRADVVLRLDYLDGDQLHRLCSLIAGRVVFPADLPDITPDDRLTPAEVLGWAKQRLDDPEAAYRLVRARLADRAREPAPAPA